MDLLDSNHLQTNQTSNGLTVAFGTGSGLAEGMLINYDNGVWYPADANSEPRSTQMCGIALGSAPSDDGCTCSRNSKIKLWCTIFSIYWRYFIC